MAQITYIKKYKENVSVFEQNKVQYVHVRRNETLADNFGEKTRAYRRAARYFATKNSQVIMRNIRRPVSPQLVNTMTSTVYSLRAQ